MTPTKIVIVGAGFGGLAAAKALRGTQASVVLIDRTNHHLFEPLLYQVATSVLAPGQIASPIRAILRKQKNTTVILGEVTGVDKDKKCVFSSDADRENVPVPYDYLVLAGPTGVEMAAALAVLVRSTLKSEFRRIDPTTARIVLVDMAPRVLPTFSKDLSEAANRRLQKLGVEVRLGHSVDNIDDDGITVAGERIVSKTVIWTAGVAPSPAGKWLNVDTDRAGRVRVQPDLSVPGHPEVFVVGDTASLDRNGIPLPGVAQVALQQGKYVGKLIHKRIAGGPAPKPFKYFDKGNMAVVGKGFAVLQTGKIHLSGFSAWLAWAAVHLQFLATSSLRVSVFLQWIWTFITGQRGSRLIVNHRGSDKETRSVEAPLGAAAATK